MVFSVDVLGQLLLCLNYFQWGMGGVGWGGVGVKRRTRSAAGSGAWQMFSDVKKKKVFMDVRR